MKLPTFTLTLSLAGLASLAAAQNGNDPLILNNRTGLSPVVYTTFSLPSLYTAPLSTDPVHTVGSVTMALPAGMSASSSGPTISVAMTRRRAANVRATRAVPDILLPGTFTALPVRASFTGAEHHAPKPRIPPPEFFSTRTAVDFPGETGEVISILPTATPSAAIPSEWWRGPIQRHSSGAHVHSASCSRDYEISAARAFGAPSTLSTVTTGAAPVPEASTVV